MHLGMVGGIEGAVLGVVSAVRTYMGVRHPHGPRERSLVIAAAIYCMIGVVLFLGVVSVLPVVYQWVAGILCAVLFAAGINAWNHAQQRIRTEETLYGTCMRHKSLRENTFHEWMN